jgi:hypothetical protein
MLPIIVMLAVSRAAVPFRIALLVIGVFAAELGYAIGYEGQKYLTPLWAALVSLLINIPILLLTVGVVEIGSQLARRRSH